MLPSMESDSAQANTLQSQTLRRLTLRENEFFRETILTCLSGAQRVWVNEIKKNAIKSRDTATLTCLSGAQMGWIN